MTDRLNCDLRPLTAKWHPLLEDGILASKDGADAFRSDLAEVRQRLRDLAEELHLMAYGSDFADGVTPEPMQPIDLAPLIEQPLAYGIPQDDQIELQKSQVGVAEINAKEAEEVEKHRAAVKNTGAGRGQDAFGVGFSGGGIRSATFCLGVT